MARHRVGKKAAHKRSRKHSKSHVRLEPTLKHLEHKGGEKRTRKSIRRKRG